MDQQDEVTSSTTESENEEDVKQDASPSEDSDRAATFLNLEELIKNHIDSIAKLREELKAQREMFEDSFNNNPTYHENEEKVKEAAKAKGSVKKQISSQPSVALLAQKVKDLRFDISEQSKTLSDLLQDYKEQTGATQIETRDGKIMELVSSVKLVKVSSK